MTFSGIIVAAGSGSRAGGGTRVSVGDGVDWSVVPSTMPRTYSRMRLSDIPFWR